MNARSARSAFSANLGEEEEEEEDPPTAVDIVHTHKNSTKYRRRSWVGGWVRELRMIPSLLVAERSLVGE